MDDSEAIQNEEENNDEVVEEEQPVDAAPQVKRKGKIDWEKAEAKLKEVESQYLSQMGLRGVNTALFFNVTLPPIRGRWNIGERSIPLYREIMRLK